VPDDTGEVAVHAPPLVGWSLVALGGVTGGYCLLRLRGRPGPDRRQAAGEALMGFGTAAMSLPLDAVSGHPWAMPALAAVFATAAVHGLLRARAGGVHLHHPLGCLAMVYMALSMTGAGAPGHTGAGPAHPGGGGIPLLTGLLLAYYAVHVLRTGRRLAPAGTATAVRGSTEVVAGAAAGRCAGALPEVATVCRLSMGIGMFTMLLAL
jgi:hypothetical protein